MELLSASVAMLRSNRDNRKKAGTISSGEETALTVIPRHRLHPVRKEDILLAIVVNRLAGFPTGVLPTLEPDTALVAAVVRGCAVLESSRRFAANYTFTLHLALPFQWVSRL